MLWGLRGLYVNEFTKTNKTAREKNRKEDIQGGLCRCDTVSEIASTPASPSEIFSNIIMSTPSGISAIFVQCSDKDLFGNTSTIIEALILITGGLANAALLWLFYRERKSLSASQVLGVNLVAMDLIYLSVVPVGMLFDIQQTQGANQSATNEEESSAREQAQAAEDILSMFILIGCPLLLACMCIERYLAVVRPVLYLTVRKSEYRLAVCAVVWFVTLCFCLATGMSNNITIVMMSVSFIISILFILMLGCLVGIIWSLQQQSPAHNASGNPARSESPLKRQAVVNVLAVVVPTVLSYLPVLGMVFLYLYMYHIYVFVNNTVCAVFEFSMIFPKFGVLIGPVFYLSKARQLCSFSRTGKRFIDNRQC